MVILNDDVSLAKRILNQSSMCWNIQNEHKHVFTIDVIPPYWHDTCI